jgi:hypothetical protein
LAAGMKHGRRKQGLLTSQRKTVPPKCVRLEKVIMSLIADIISGSIYIVKLKSKTLRFNLSSIVLRKRFRRAFRFGKF